MQRRLLSMGDSSWEFENALTCMKICLDLWFLTYLYIARFSLALSMQIMNGNKKICGLKVPPTPDLEAAEATLSNKKTALISGNL